VGSLLCLNAKMTLCAIGAELKANSRCSALRPALLRSGTEGIGLVKQSTS